MALKLDMNRMTFRDCQEYHDSLWKDITSPRNFEDNITKYYVESCEDSTIAVTSSLEEPACNPPLGIIEKDVWSDQYQNPPPSPSSSPEPFIPRYAPPMSNGLVYDMGHNPHFELQGVYYCECVFGRNHYYDMYGNLYYPCNNSYYMGNAVYYEYPYDMWRSCDYDRSWNWPHFPPSPLQHMNYERCVQRDTPGYYGKNVQMPSARRQKKKNCVPPKEVKAVYDYHFKYIRRE